MFAGKQAQEFI